MAMRPDHRAWSPGCGVSGWYVIDEEDLPRMWDALEIDRSAVRAMRMVRFGAGSVGVQVRSVHHADA